MEHFLVVSLFMHLIHQICPNIFVQAPSDRIWHIVAVLLSLKFFCQTFELTDTKKEISRARQTKSFRIFEPSRECQSERCPLGVESEMLLIMPNCQSDSRSDFISENLRIEFWIFEFGCLSKEDVWSRRLILSELFASESRTATWSQKLWILTLSSISGALSSTSCRTCQTNQPNRTE